jgi:hypothetical protein
MTPKGDIPSHILLKGSNGNFVNLVRIITWSCVAGRQQERFGDRSGHNTNSETFFLLQAQTTILDIEEIGIGTSGVDIRRRTDKHKSFQESPEEDKTLLKISKGLQSTTYSISGFSIPLQISVNGVRKESAIGENGRTSQRRLRSG